MRSACTSSALICIPSLTVLHSGVLVGGNFATAGQPTPVAVNHLGYYRENQWSTLGNFQEVYVPHWQVMSLDTLPDGAVVAAGLFQNVSGSQLVNNIGKSERESDAANEFLFGRRGRFLLCTILCTIL